MGKPRYILRNCERCEKPFNASAWEVTQGRSRFCSYVCARNSRKVVDRTQRFWNKVEKKETECWEWTGRLNMGGYGSFSIKPERPVMAHRYSWIMQNGSIPDGMIICHKCDNPKCVNPDHLFLGTHKDNTQDAIAKKRHVAAFDIPPQRKYANGSRQWKSKLEEKDIPIIFELSKSLDALQISEKLLVSRSTIYGILKKKTWKHVST